MWSKRVYIIGAVVLISGLIFLGVTRPAMAEEEMGMSMGRGMMGKGMMGMMGMMGMHRMCPMMGKGVKMEIKELKDGISITYRATDPKQVKRLKIMGQMMKLMQEMMELR